MIKFGIFIKAKREALGMTQTELGALLHINSSALSRIENGVKPFSKKKLKLLSNSLKVDFQEIKDLFFASKFAQDVVNYQCSESVFQLAEESYNYISLKGTNNGK